MTAFVFFYKRKMKMENLEKALLILKTLITFLTPQTKRKILRGFLGSFLPKVLFFGLSTLLPNLFVFSVLMNIVNVTIFETNPLIFYLKVSSQLFGLFMVMLIVIVYVKLIFISENIVTNTSSM